MTKLDPDKLKEFEASCCARLRSTLESAHHMVQHELPYTDYAHGVGPQVPPIKPHRVGMREFTAKDLTRLNTSKGQVFLLAMSGRWFTNRELIELTGSIDAPKRRRELEHVDGYRFEKRKINGTNVLEFRLIQETET